MQMDKEFEYETDGRIIGCTVLNSSLNEDLGCVNIIFSDKTGTITQNKMLFHSLATERETLTFNYENGDLFGVDDS